jgi:hypothetical protein
LVGPHNARRRRAVPTVGNRGVLVGVKHPDGVVVGKVLKRPEAAPQNTPQALLCRVTVREGQDVLVGQIPVLHEG